MKVLIYRNLHARGDASKAWSVVAWGGVNKDRMTMRGDFICYAAHPLLRDVTFVVSGSAKRLRERRNAGEIDPRTGRLLSKQPVAWAAGELVEADEIVILADLPAQPVTYSLDGDETFVTRDAERRPIRTA